MQSMSVYINEFIVYSIFLQVVATQSRKKKTKRKEADPTLPFSQAKPKLKQVQA